MSRADDLRVLRLSMHATSEGSPSLDEAIHAALLPDDAWWKCIAEGRRLVAAGEPDRYVAAPPRGLGTESQMRADSWATSARVPSYTTSLDAALWLVGEVLPGWSWAVGLQGGRFRASISRPSPLRPMPLIATGCATAGLTLVAVLLSAVIAQEDDDGDRR